MKIRITESQYNILVNKPKDVVFGRVNEARLKLSPEEEDKRITEILDYVRGGGEFGRYYKYYKWLYERKSSEKEDEHGKFKNVWNEIKKIQTELENKKIDKILDYVRGGGQFIRVRDKDEHYRWLIDRVDRNEKFQNALDDIAKIQIELDDKEVERIKNHVRNGGKFLGDPRRWIKNKFYNTDKKKYFEILGEIDKIQTELDNKKIKEILDYVRGGGEFIREYNKDDNYKWLINKFKHTNKEKFENVLNQIKEIQIELGIKREWWGEKTIKNILERMEFNGVVPRHKYKKCKNSLTCRQYEFDIYLPYNENNVKINENIPENGIIFEYDGIQHFEFIPYFHKTEEKFNSQIFRDKEKNLFCKNNIKLVRIPYTSKTEEDIEQDINLALDNPNTFILTGDYPKAGWNK